MRTSELRKLLNEIRADQKSRKKSDAWFVEARLARQHLAQSPPTKDDLGGVRYITVNMTPQELEACRQYHSFLVACFDSAISIQNQIIESWAGESERCQKFFEEFGAECWTTIDEQCREATPDVYFQIMLPHVNSLMKALKQRKKIKPTKSEFVQR